MQPAHHVAQQGAVARLAGQVSGVACQELGDRAAQLSADLAADRAVMMRMARMP